MAENVDEDSAVKHWLAVHRRDQVGNFLFGRSGCEKHISSGEKYITFQVVIREIDANLPDYLEGE